MRHRVSAFPVCLLLLCAMLALSAPLAAQEIARDGDQVFRKVGPDAVPVVSRLSVTHAVNDWNSDIYDWDEVKDSTLYYMRDGSGHWELALDENGAPLRLRPWTLERKWPYFAFNAPSDGLYGFYFVRNDKRSLPIDNQTMPDKTIYVDSSAPTISDTEPREGSIYTLGEQVPIRYVSYDDTPLVEGGLSIEYRLAGSEEWKVAVESAPNTGEYMWTPDPEVFPEKTAIDVRLNVRDALAFGRAERIAQHTGSVVINNLIVGNYVYQAPQDVRTDKPSISVAGPDYGRVLNEYTDFFYEVTNNTGSPLDAVVLYYSMDNGATWQVGGVNDSGTPKGRVTVHFAQGFRRHGVFGNYSRIDFYYQAITEDSRTNAMDPVSGTSPMAAYPVDTRSPLLHLVTPALGDVLYRSPIPGNTESGKYSITWNSFDNNHVEYNDQPGYESGPVKLWYTTTPNDPAAKWTLLADRLPARGTFTRKNDLPVGMLQVKVEALDQMGNHSERVSGIFEVKDGSGWEPAKPLGTGVDYTTLWREANELSAAEDYEGARAKYDSAEALAPTEQRDAIIRDRAASEYQAGNTAKAMQLFRAIVDRNADNLRFRYDLAVLHYQLGQRAEATMHLEEIRRLDDAQPMLDARLLLAKLYSQDGRYKESANEYQFVINRAQPATDRMMRAKDGMASVKKKLMNK